MSSNKPDTSWFDLKNYEPLQSMPIEGWIEVIENRVIAYSDEWNMFRKRFVNIIKYCPIRDDSSRSAWRFEQIAKSKEFQQKFSTGSVNSLSVYDVFLMSQDLNNQTSFKMLELNEACLHRKDSEVWRDTTDISFEPYEIATKNAFREDMTLIHAANVSVNMFATDAQIKRDFDVWLEKYRDKINSKSNKPQYDTAKDKKDKKTYTQVDFKQWILNRVIPYIDLLIVKKYEQIEYTEDKLIDMLFKDFIAQKNYNGDLKGKLKKTKEVADSLLNSHMHRALSAQVLSTKLGSR